jgi:hypothetical protein
MPISFLIRNVIKDLGVLIASNLCFFFEVKESSVMLFLRKKNLWQERTNSNEP